MATRKSTSGGGGGQQSLYELHSTLGLDLQPFAAGLLEGDAMIEQFTQRLTQLQQAGYNAAQAMSIAGAQMAQDARRLALAAQTTTTPRELVTTQRDIVDKLTANAELASADARRRAQEASDIAETRRIAAQRKFYREQEIASDKEYAALKKQLSAEVTAANRAALQQQRAQAIEERELAKQQRLAVMAARGGALSPGGIGAEIRSSFYLGGTLQALGVKVPMGLTSILGRLEQVQLAMAAAFDVLAVTAFITIIAGLGEKIKEVADEWAGFGEEARKAWAAAADGASQAMLKLAEFQHDLAAARRTGLQPGSAEEKAAELTDIRSERARRQAQIQLIGQQRNEAQRMLDILNKVNQPEGNIAVRGLGPSVPIAQANLIELNRQISQGLIPGARNEKEAREVLKANIDRDNEAIKAHYDALSRLSLEEIKNANQKERETKELQKRMRDPVHEMPWRLPWFLQPNPADFFIESLRNAPARRGSFPGAPPELIHRAGSRDTAGMTIQQNFNPVYHLEGSLDAKQLADKLHPVILENHKNNTRESTDQLAQILKNAGFIVSV